MKNIFIIDGTSSRLRGDSQYIRAIENACKHLGQFFPIAYHTTSRSWDSIQQTPTTREENYADFELLMNAYSAASQRRTINPQKLIHSICTSGKYDAMPAMDTLILTDYALEHDGERLGGEALSTSRDERFAIITTQYARNHDEMFVTALHELGHTYGVARARYTSEGTHCRNDCIMQPALSPSQMLDVIRRTGEVYCNPCRDDLRS